MKSMVPNRLVAAIGLFLAATAAAPAQAEDAPAAQPPAAAAPAGGQKQAATPIRIGYLRAYAPQLALSVLDVPPRDDGVAGAKVAIGDNNTTGKFLGQKFTLEVTEVKPDAEVVAAFKEMVAKGDRYVLTDLSADAAAVDRRYRPRQGRAALQCRRDRRHSARGGVPRERLPHPADPHHAGRRTGAISDLEAMAADGC